MRIGLFILLLTAIAFSGCSGNTNNNANSNSNANRVEFKPPEQLKPAGAADPNYKSCNEYYPLIPHSVAKYVLNYASGLVADATVIVYPSEENGRTGFIERTRIIDRSGGFQIVQDTERHFVCDGDKVQILTEKNDSRIEGNPSGSEFTYRENSYLMIEPSSLVRKDANWTFGFRSIYRRPGEAPAAPDAPVIVSSTVKGEEEVTLPTGTVKAVKIERKIGENLVEEYFTRGLGLVKRGFQGNTWELKEYSGMRPLE